MNLEKFLGMPAGHTMTWEQAAELNGALAQVSDLEFTPEQRSRIADYLTTALNLGSVEPGLVPALDALLVLLQDPLN